MYFDVYICEPTFKGRLEIVVFKFISYYLLTLVISAR